MNIKLTKKQKIKILNADDLFIIMRDILIREDKIDLNREHFWVVGLENNNRLLFIEMISLGSVNEVLVEPMEVFSFALQKRAVKLILVHNHPSGELKPSDGDKDIIDQMIQAGRIVKTSVIDHLIITTKSFLSFADIGLLEELEKSTKYVPPYILEERIRKEERKIRKEEVTKAKKKKAIEMAKAMKEDGESIQKIEKNTNLSKDEIGKL